MSFHFFSIVTERQMGNRWCCAPVLRDVANPDDDNNNNNARCNTPDPDTNDDCRALRWDEAVVSLPPPPVPLIVDQRVCPSMVRSSTQVRLVGVI